MLVGVGGSGKKSLTTISAALALAKVDTIEPKKNYGKKEFKVRLIQKLFPFPIIFILIAPLKYFISIYIQEDLYRMMKKVGIENQNLVFLFVDTQILQESFLEDVNNLLNSGEVPNMLQKDEMDEINSGL